MTEPKERKWTHDEIDFMTEFCDGEPEDDYDIGEECGRWDNGKLTKSCSKAGSEECDWECPYRSTLYK